MSNRNLRVSRREWLRFKSEISPILKSIMQFSGGDSGGNESDRGFFNRKRLWANSPIIENKIKCDSDIKVVISLENRKTTLENWNSMEFWEVSKVTPSFVAMIVSDIVYFRKSNWKSNQSVNHFTQTELIFRKRKSNIRLFYLLEWRFWGVSKRFPIRNKIHSVSKLFPRMIFTYIHVYHCISDSIIQQNAVKLVELVALDDLLGKCWEFDIFKLLNIFSCGHNLLDFGRMSR